MSDLYKNIKVNEMIDESGKKMYAYVTLLIIDEQYASASITLAESLRKIGSQSELIILIDENISKETIDLLRYFYDRIIKITKIEIKHEDNVQKYILTKLYALNFEEYKKIIIIDIDSLILRYPDNAFMLKPPGAIYDNKKKIFTTGFILLKPDKKKYEYIIKKIDKIDLSNKNKPLSYLLDILYDKINKLNDNILKSNEYKNYYGIQYNDNKPFILKNKISIEERIKWDNFKLWFYYFRYIINKYSFLNKYSCLKETINLSKYYIATLSIFMIDFRSIINNQEKMSKEISNLYNKKIINNLNYYHLDISKEYNSENINYLPNDNTFQNFIIYLKKKNNLYHFLDDLKNIKDTISYLNIEDNQEKIILLNNFLREYSRLYTNIFIILLINNKNKINNENLIYKKNIELDGLALKNILFNIDQKYVYEQRLINLLKYEDNKLYNLELLFYQTIYPIEFKNDTTDILIFENTIEKIRITSILLNINSINMFIQKKINFIDLTNKNLFKILNFQTLKKWLYNNYSGNTLDNIIIYSNIIIDTNKYKPIKIRMILNKKIDDYDYIFSESPHYLNKSKNFIKIIKNINNCKYYYEIEGIKFSIIKID